MLSLGRRPRAAFFVFAGASRAQRVRGDRGISTRRLRALVVAALILLAWSPAQGLETTRQLLEGGAPRLALDRVERNQPRDATDSRWSEWEMLRLRALSALERHRELLDRVNTVAADLVERERGQAWALAARSALEAGEPVQARSFAARALWASSTTPEQERALRVLVIDSYLAEGNGHVAFRAMLRFAQDYHPLEPATAARFVEGLLALDMAREAANWLARLEEGSPAKQMLRLKAGLLKPDAAIAQSRSQLAKGDALGHWRVIAEAAQQGGKRSTHIEALEQLVQQAPGRKKANAAAAALWESYQASADQAANLNHLLAGDDAAWMKYALERSQADPFIARAFFAYLGQRAGSQEARQTAFRQLVLSLQKSKLERVALRLLDQGDIGLAAIDGETRLRLGAIAGANGEAAVAARLWAGLDAPSGMTRAEWDLRRALAYWRAEETDAAIKSLATAAGEKQLLPEKAVEHAIALGREMGAAGRAQLADTSLGALLQVVGPKHQRELLMALGDAAEKSGRFAQAGAYFLQAALAPDGHPPDATASTARLAAGLNLARAGYKDDARAQFDWVIRHSRDAAERDVARKGRAKL